MFGSRMANCEKISKVRISTLRSIWFIARCIKVFYGLRLRLNSKNGVFEIIWLCWARRESKREISSLGC